MATPRHRYTVKPQSGKEKVIIDADFYAHDDSNGIIFYRLPLTDFEEAREVAIVRSFEYMLIKQNKEAP